LSGGLAVLACTVTPPLLLFSQAVGAWSFNW
jgi:hypothetical protein